MKMHCASCSRAFEPNRELLGRVEDAKRRGLRMMMASCPVCGRTMPIDLNPSATSKRAEDDRYRCPIAGCAGLAVKVQASDSSCFWGCGECGNVWHTDEGLYSDISEIIKKYSYRAAVYIRVGWAFQPAGIEPKVYEDKVARET